MTDLIACSIPECNSPARRESFCWRHWAFWDATGDPLSTVQLLRNASPFTRMMRFVVEDTATGCWMWTGGKNGDGYGLAKLIRPGLPASTQMAHRAVYKALVGPIEAESLDHLCRVRACVNPEHMEPVSMKVNTRRGNTLAARYAERTHCDKGHEFSPENTIIRSDKGGRARRCRECKRAQGRGRYVPRR